MSSFGPVGIRIRTKSGQCLHNILPEFPWRRSLHSEAGELDKARIVRQGRSVDSLTSRLRLLLSATLANCDGVPENIRSEWRILARRGTRHIMRASSTICRARSVGNSRNAPGVTPVIFLNVR